MVISAVGITGILKSLLRFSNQMFLVFNPRDRVCYISINTCLVRFIFALLFSTKQC